jgi:hypothetical protein
VSASARRLVRLKHCSEWDVCRALAQQFGLPARESVEILEIEDELVERLPIQFARINSVLPWKLDRQLGVLRCCRPTRCGSSTSTTCARSTARSTSTSR